MNMTLVMFKYVVYANFNFIYKYKKIINKVRQGRIVPPCKMNFKIINWQKKIMFKDIFGYFFNTIYIEVMWWRVA